MTPCSPRRATGAFHHQTPAPQLPVSPEPCSQGRAALSCPGALRQPPTSLTLSQASRDFTSCAFWQDRMDPARLSMTPSTDSSVKKVICSGEERGCQPGPAA